MNLRVISCIIVEPEFRNNRDCLQFKIFIERQGKNEEKSAVYTLVNEHFRIIFNAVFEQKDNSKQPLEFSGEKLHLHRDCLHRDFERFLKMLDPYKRQYICLNHH